MRRIDKMPYVIGYRMRIYPSNRQKEIIEKNFGAARFLYNRLVARERELHLLRGVKIYCQPVADRIRYLESLGTKPSDLKAAYPFLEDPDIDSLMIANTIRNHHRAWDNFFNVPGTGIPTFHKKKESKSYKTNAQYRDGASRIGDCNVHITKDRHITLPKLGRVRFGGSDRIFRILDRGCETRIGTITVSVNAIGEYYVSIQIGSVRPFSRKLRKAGHNVGIDMNLENFCTDSDGNVTENPRYRRKAQKKLAKAQRKLARRGLRAKREGRSLGESKNYQKQRVKTAKIQLKAARQREAFQHKESKRFIERQDAIFAEDLKTKELMQNNRLAGAIADAAWGNFHQKLEYKANLYGRTFLKVPAWNTTQTCGCCGYVLTGDEKIGLEVREWDCPRCKAHLLRDPNSATIVLQRGLALLNAGTV